MGRVVGRKASQVWAFNKVSVSWRAAIAIALFMLLQVLLLHAYRLLWAVPVITNQNQCEKMVYLRWKHLQ